MNKSERNETLEDQKRTTGSKKFTKNKNAIGRKTADTKQSKKDSKKKKIENDHKLVRE